MPTHVETEKFTDPVRGDEVPKLDNAVAIGEDLQFQEKWWKFERAIWIFFLCVLLADVLGLFGRGWLAKATLGSPQNGFSGTYERIERAGTPSIMRIHIEPDAIQDGTFTLFVSESLLRELGTQRVIPQPEHSILGGGGVTYVFPAHGDNTSIQLQLEPSFPGVHTFAMRVPGRPPVQARVVVVP